MTKSTETVAVHLYGRFRQLAPDKRTDADSVVRLTAEEGDTIARILERLGISAAETSNIFLNGELSALTRKVNSGDRLGIFPSDMALLYKWYFEKKD